MNENKRGYWVYSIVAVVIGMALFGFIAYLIYDLIIKLSEKDFSNNTVVQALITLVITIFIGGYFSKWLERNNAKKIELYKIRTSISLKIIELSSAICHHPENIELQNALKCESSKVKLYFPNEVLRAINVFLSSENKSAAYEPLIDSLRKNVQ